MNVAPGVPVLYAPSTSTNTFDNKKNMSTKEGIFVWKRATDPDKLLDHIALTFETAISSWRKWRANVLSLTKKNHPNPNYRERRSSELTRRSLQQFWWIHKASVWLPLTLWRSSHRVSMILLGWQQCAMRQIVSSWYINFGFHHGGPRTSARKEETTILHLHRDGIPNYQE